MILTGWLLTDLYYACFYTLQDGGIERCKDTFPSKTKVQGIFMWPTVFFLFPVNTLTSLPDRDSTEQQGRIVWYVFIWHSVVCIKVCYRKSCFIIFVFIHVIELLCYNWRFANFWLEIWSHNWRFFIDGFDACFYCLFLLFVSVLNQLHPISICIMFTFLS